MLQRIIELIAVGLLIIACSSYEGWMFVHILVIVQQWIERSFGMIYSLFDYPSFWILVMGVFLVIIVIAAITAAVIIRNSIDRLTAVLKQWVNLMTPSANSVVPRGTYNDKLRK